MTNPPLDVKKQSPHLEIASHPNPEIDAIAVAKKMHSISLPGVVFGMALIPIVGKDGGKEAFNYARDVISRMAPRDAAEEMLVAQLLFAHARVLRLTEMTQHATTVEMIRVIHEYADRASNTYRRLMLALAEYRRPFRTGDTIAVVQQANITNQQVVHAHENRTNEQGFERRGDAGVAANDDAATPLPIESVGTDFLAGLSEALETMGIVHGSKDRGR